MFTTLGRSDTARAIPEAGATYVKQVPHKPEVVEANFSQELILLSLFDNPLAVLVKVH